MNTLDLFKEAMSYGQAHLNSSKAYSTDKTIDGYTYSASIRNKEIKDCDLNVSSRFDHQTPEEALQDVIEKIKTLMFRMGKVA